MSTLEILTDIEINTSKENAWKVLTNFGDYNNWNPVMYNMAGKAQVGSEVSFMIKAVGSLALPITKCIVQVADPQKAELRWIGPQVPGLDKIAHGNHYFIIQELDKNKVKLTHGELFEGLSIGLLKPLMQPALQDAYSRVNDAFKKKCEQS